MDQQNSHGPIRALLVIATIFLTLLSQILLYATPINDTVVLPSSAWLGMLGILIFVLIQYYRPMPALQILEARLSSKNPAGWIIFAGVLSILAAEASHLFEEYALTNFIPVLSIWFLSAVCYILAFFPTESAQRDWKAWFRAHSQELLRIGLVIVLAAALRFYQLGQLPRVINGDEGRIGLFAQGSTVGPLSNPFALWENIGALYLHLINMCFSLLGATPFSLRLLPAIGGTLAIPAVYLLARQIGGKRIALIAAALLAFSHTHLHFSRTVAVSYIQSTWLTPLELYFLLSGLEKRSSWRTALGGILLAFHMSIYISAQITVGILLVYMLIAFLWLKDEFRPAWRQALVFWGGFLITFVPEGFYMLFHPTETLNRLNADGTFNSGWLINEIASTGKPALQILGERLIHTFLSLIYYPAIDFYGSPTPMLTIFASVLFLLGLGFVLTRARSLNFLLLNGNFWGAVVAVGIFAVPPSADSYRMLIALPAALLMAAFGLDQVLTLLGLGWEKSRFQYIAISSTLLLLLLVSNMWTYFYDFAYQCRYGGDPQTRFASYLGNYARRLDKEVNIVLLSNDVFSYGSHASVDFLSQKRQITNFRDPLDTLVPVPSEIIVANPDRIAELRTWVQNHPGGQLHYEYDCTKIFLLAYQVP
jgi:hypothetical protein